LQTRFSFLVEERRERRKKKRRKMTEFINSVGPYWMHDLKEYERKRDLIMARENRDILREQVMRGLADFYRMKRHELYKGMREGMQKSEEACVDILELWPYIRKLLDELVVLAAASKGSETEFNEKLRHALRYIVVLYDHVVPSIDRCRTRYAHELFAPVRFPSTNPINE
jgi:hypothetical protein